VGLVDKESLSFLEWRSKNKSVIGVKHLKDLHLHQQPEITRVDLLDRPDLNN